MDLGWSDWAGARGSQLVEPTVLATGHRAAQGDAVSAGGTRVGFVAWSGGGAAVQRGVFAICLARLCRFWLRRARRYGFLQLRHDFSRPEAGGSGERRSQLKRPL